MDTARYYVAKVVVIAFPPPVIAWLFIHPLADTWRRIGVFGTYVLIFSFYAMGMFAIWLVSDYLLVVDFGSSAPLLVFSIILWCASICVRILWRRILRPSTILGLPEIRGEHEQTHLATKGIYSYIRHPRYIEAGLLLWAAAFFSNNLASYIVGVAYIPLIYAVVILEERELRKRFGAAYEDYCSRVPRFIPKIRSHN